MKLSKFLQLTDLEGRTNNLTITFNQVQAQCLVYVNQYETLAREIQDLRKSAPSSSSTAASAPIPAVTAVQTPMFALPQASSSSSSSSNKSVISQNKLETNNNKSSSDVVAARK